MLPILVIWAEVTDCPKSKQISLNRGNFTYHRFYSRIFPCLFSFSWMLFAVQRYQEHLFCFPIPATSQLHSSFSASLPPFSAATAATTTAEATTTTGRLPPSLHLNNRMCTIVLVKCYSSKTTALVFRRSFFGSKLYPSFGHLLSLLVPSKQFGNLWIWRLAEKVPCMARIPLTPLAGLGDLLMIDKGNLG